ncbi:hypothetical protein SLS57_010250 [Botryosphaeria dothidea]
MFNAEYMRNRKRTAQIGRTYSKNLAEARGSPISGWQFMEQEKIGALQLANARNLNNLADCVTRLDIYSGNPYVSAHDVQSWRWLYDRFQGQFEQVQQLLEIYAGRAAVGESFLANQQARHVGQLTTLATILVPFTVVAGIFSMSGSFAAGESHFWVFWVVAVPISALLFLNVLAGRRPGLVRSIWETWRRYSTHLHILIIIRH